MKKHHSCPPQPLMLPTPIPTLQLLGNSLMRKGPGEMEHANVQQPEGPPSLTWSHLLLPPALFGTNKISREFWECSRHAPLTPFVSVGLSKRKVMAPELKVKGRRCEALCLLLLLVHQVFLLGRQGKRATSSTGQKEGLPPA